MNKITEEILRVIMPTAPKNLADFVNPVNEIFSRFAVNTTERAACFLAQAAHESGAFRYTREIASGKEYEGRADLGNTEAGDGEKYKGGGLLQITGKYNYLMCGEVLYPEDKNFLVQHPEQISTPKNSVLSAGWYWQYRKLNAICDLPASFSILHNGKTYNRFEWLTYHINGGLNGIQDRIIYYERAISTLS